MQSIRKTLLSSPNLIFTSLWSNAAHKSSSCSRSFVTLSPSDLTMTPRTLSLADRVLTGDRTALSKAITLVESQRYDHQTQAHLMLSYLLKNMASQQSHPSSSPSQFKRSFRVGISGPPGAGKSTFIEAIGRLITSQGLKLAVLTIDPSSPRTGGSILGDKTRMIELARDPHAYVRPSPSGCSLGGVAAHTYETVMLCEAAQFDVTFVETVGVGQSETEVSNLVDMFMLLVPPGGGDELQGIKKGIVELCDMVVVNKADGHLLTAARHAKTEFMHALQLTRHRSDAWNPKVLMCSSIENKSVEEVWKELQTYRTIVEESGLMEKRRLEQRKEWMWKQIREELMARLFKAPGVKETIESVQQQVLAGEVAPRFAAEKVLDRFFAEEKK